MRDDDDDDDDEEEEEGGTGRVREGDLERLMRSLSEDMTTTTSQQSTEGFDQFSPPVTIIPELFSMPGSVAWNDITSPGVNYGLFWPESTLPESLYIDSMQEILSTVTPPWSYQQSVAPGTPNSSLSSECFNSDTEDHSHHGSSSAVPPLLQQSSVLKRKTPDRAVDDELKPSHKVRRKGPKRVREPRYAIQARSEVEIMEDGYKWRKYGQKAVKNSPHPRSYYRCTNPKCPVRKRVERSADDTGLVITTYEGTHTHITPSSTTTVTGSSRAGDAPLLPANSGSEHPPGGAPYQPPEPVRISTVKLDAEISSGPLRPTPSISKPVIAIPRAPLPASLLTLRAPQTNLKTQSMQEAICLSSSAPPEFRNSYLKPPPASSSSSEGLLEDIVRHRR